MRKSVRLPVFLALAACLASCSTEEPTATVVYLGPYTYSTSRSIDAPRSPSGKQTLVRNPQFGTLTDRIALVPETAFGIAYVVSGPEKGTRVQLRRVWKFPPPGLRNRTTGDLHPSDEGPTACIAGDTCLAGWIINTEEEPPAGKWEVEIWHEQRRLVQQAFHLKEEPGKDASK